MRPMRALADAANATFDRRSAAPPSTNRSTGAFRYPSARSRSRSSSGRSIFIGASHAPPGDKLRQRAKPVRARAKRVEGALGGRAQFRGQLPRAVHAAEGHECGLPRIGAHGLARFRLGADDVEQIVDDLLDVVGTEAETGKAVRADARKTTFVSFSGVEGASELAAELCATAERALEPFGRRADPLRQLAQFVAGRRT